MARGGAAAVWKVRGSIDASDLDDALAAVRRLGEPLASIALADALNHTANQARQVLRAEMEDVFKSPTPWTLNSIRILHATPQKLEAALWVQDQPGEKSPFSAEDYLLPQVEGGERITRQSENWLRKAGILPAGRFVVPASGARLDEFGNMQRGHMMQILSGLRAIRLSGSDHGATDSKRSKLKGHARAFFVVRRGSRAVGIGERRTYGKNSRHKWVMVLAFVRQPQYRDKFKFADVVRRVAENDGQLETNIDKAIAKALSGQISTNFKRRSRDAAGNITR